MPAAPDCGYEDWSGRLPCDRPLELSSAGDGNPRAALRSFGERIGLAMASACERSRLRLGLLATLNWLAVLLA
jgi:hypothetical protein